MTLTSQTQSNEVVGFALINCGFNAVFKSNHLSLGLVVALESYDASPVPTMAGHLDRIKLAERTWLCRCLAA